MVDGMVRLEMGDFSSQGHLEHLAYVVRMAILWLKFDRFTSQFPNFFACGAQELDLAYVYVVSVAGRWWIRMDAARSLL